nr:nucleotidyltransferase substrate binding protein [Alcanivorax quisquiliarum]
MLCFTARPRRKEVSRVQPDIFKKVVSRLEEAIRQEKNDFIRDSVIQRFEFSIELAWKTAKKSMGVTTAAPKM